jgi:hypothetical protein
MVEGLWSKAPELGFRDLGLRFEVWGLRFGVWGLGVWGLQVRD